MRVARAGHLRIRRARPAVLLSVQEQRALADARRPRGGLGRAPSLKWTHESGLHTSGPPRPSPAPPLSPGLGGRGVTSGPGLGSTTPVRAPIAVPARGAPSSVIRLSSAAAPPSRARAAGASSPVHGAGVSRCPRPVRSSSPVSAPSAVQADSASCRDSRCLVRGAVWCGAVRCGAQTRAGGFGAKPCEGGEGFGAGASAGGRPGAGGAARKGGQGRGLVRKGLGAGTGWRSGRGVRSTLGCRLCGLGRGLRSCSRGRSPSSTFSVPDSAAVRPQARTRRGWGGGQGTLLFGSGTRAFLGPARVRAPGAGPTPTVSFA